MWFRVLGTILMLVVLTYSIGCEDEQRRQPAVAEPGRVKQSPDVVTKAQSNPSAVQDWSAIQWPVEDPPIPTEVQTKLPRTALAQLGKIKDAEKQFDIALTRTEEDKVDAEIKLYMEALRERKKKYEILRQR